jgi:triosephosphate isomerase (TIM)
MLIAGNWKMFKGPREAAEFCRALRDAALPEGVDAVVAPSYVSLSASVQALAGTEIGVFAQNCHWESDGAFTGEISVSMLQELGVYGTIVGHSERRQYFGETDETVAKRCRAALEGSLHVIACVGETLAEREAGETDQVLRRQVGVLEDDDNLVIAYEPVWAIGTGRVASAADAQEVCKAIRDELGKLASPQLAAGVRVLYGGSVNAKNVGEIAAQEDVDGALVGGASLDGEQFATLSAIAAGGPLP